jgi:hypothetical protein
VDATSSILRGRVKVFVVEARRVDVLGVSAARGEPVEDLSHEKLTAFAPLLSAVEIPVRLDGRITIPGLGPAGSHRPAAEVPWGFGGDVKSFRHRPVGDSEGRGPGRAAAAKTRGRARRGANGPHEARSDLAVVDDPGPVVQASALAAGCRRALTLVPSVAWAKRVNTKPLEPVRESVKEDPCSRTCSRTKAR